jgi:hypothetical protein
MENLPAPGLTGIKFIATYFLTGRITTAGLNAGAKVVVAGSAARERINLSPTRHNNQAGDKSRKHHEPQSKLSYFWR